LSRSLHYRKAAEVPMAGSRQHRYCCRRHIALSTESLVIGIVFAVGRVRSSTAARAVGIVLPSAQHLMGLPRSNDR
jgi:hypothetical protein